MVKRDVITLEGKQYSRHYSDLTGKHVYEVHTANGWRRLSPKYVSLQARIDMTLDGDNQDSAMTIQNPKEQREHLVAEADRLLGEAVAVLAVLVDSYPGERLSACHPKLGYDSTRTQIERIRKSLKNARV